MGFPGGSEDKAFACNAGDPGSIPGSGRSPGEGNGSPLQDSGLENPRDRRAWWATVHEVTGSDTTEGLHFRFLPIKFASALGSCVRLLPTFFPWTLTNGAVMPYQWESTSSAKNLRVHF